MTKFDILKPIVLQADAIFGDLKCGNIVLCLKKSKNNDDRYDVLTPQGTVISVYLLLAELEQLVDT